MLLAIAAIVAAVVTARAALLASDATGSWQTSVGDEQRRGAVLLEGVRYTYGSEGDMAVMLITADVQAQELRSAAASLAPEVGAILEGEALVQQQVVDLAGPSSELYTDPRYRLDSGGVDLQLRLADARATEDLDDDPLAALASGDAAGDAATRLMQTTLVIAGAFLFGALAQTFARRRRLLLALGWIALAAGGLAAIAVEMGLRGAAA